MINHKVRDKVLVEKEGTLCKADFYMTKSHGLSQQFIQMEPPGFNAGPNQKDLISREYYYLQKK
jgi:hypothetical protein